MKKYSRINQSKLGTKNYSGEIIYIDDTETAQNEWEKLIENIDIAKQTNDVKKINYYQKIVRAHQNFVFND